MNTHRGVALLPAMCNRLSLLSIWGARVHIRSKYRGANLDQQAIGLLPQVVTFLGSLAFIDGHALTEEGLGLSVAKLADEAEN